MRFRKSIKIAPGLKINLSKSGVSTTIGGKGLSANIGSKGAYLNTGIPGTGVSARHKIAGGGGSRSGGQGDPCEYMPKGRNDRVIAEAVAMGDPFRPIPGVDKPRSKVTAYLLWFFLGMIGGHKFYLKKSGMGFLYLITIGLLGIGWFIDLFTLGKQVDAFNQALAEWGLEAPAK
jgi:TM2 domain-containing membrane protein YozV